MSGTGQAGIQVVRQTAGNAGQQCGRWLCKASRKRSILALVSGSACHGAATGRLADCWQVIVQLYALAHPGIPYQLTRAARLAPAYKEPCRRNRQAAPPVSPGPCFLDFGPAAQCKTADRSPFVGSLERPHASTHPSLQPFIRPWIS